MANKITRLIATKLFSGVIDEKLEEARIAASKSDDEIGFRKLTGNSERKLPNVDQDRMFEICYWLWKNNPLGNWTIEVVTAFIVGEGFKIESKNDRVKEVLDDFWHDPVNAMDIYLEKYTRELGIYGEQCVTRFVSENAGKVRLGYIDPSNIKEVVTDPYNVKAVIAVILKSKAGDDERRLKTVLSDGAEEILSKKAKEIRDGCNDGDCYFNSINNVTNDPRGTSDLFVVADWLDAYEEFLFDYTDKWPLLNSFVWDLMVEGGNEKTLKEQLKMFSKKSGSAFAHNEKVTLEAKTPDLKAADAAEGSRLLRNHILGNMSIPEHWYGGGGDVNRATALEMGAPAFKMMNSRQRIIIYAITNILNDVIAQADAKNMLAGVPDDEKTFTVITPELASKDITKFSTAIKELSGSLVQAQVNEWVDKETAVKIFAFSLALVGYELDTEAVDKALNTDKDDEGADDYLGK